MRAGKIINLVVIVFGLLAACSPEEIEGHQESEVSQVNNEPAIERLLREAGQEWILGDLGEGRGLAGGIWLYASDLADREKARFSEMLAKLADLPAIERAWVQSFWFEGSSDVFPKNFDFGIFPNLDSITLRDKYGGPTANVLATLSKTSLGRPENLLRRVVLNVKNLSSFDWVQHLYRLQTLIVITDSPIELPDLTNLTNLLNLDLRGKDILNFENLNTIPAKFDLLLNRWYDLVPILVHSNVRFIHLDEDVIAAHQQDISGLIEAGIKVIRPEE